MQIPAYSRYSDYSANSIYARNRRRATGEPGALVRKVGDRTEEERRRAASRRRPEPVANDGNDSSNVVAVPFAVGARRDANVETMRVVPPAVDKTLWSLIDAVEAGGAPSASPEPRVATFQTSPAESLYLLLAQVVSDD